MLILFEKDWIENSPKTICLVFYLISFRGRLGCMRDRPKSGTSCWWWETWLQKVFIVNWKGSLEGSLSCFIYQRASKRAHLLRFFPNVGTSGVIATKAQTKHLQTHSQALDPQTYRTYVLQSCKLRLIRCKIVYFLYSCHSVSQRSGSGHHLCQSGQPGDVAV